MPTEYPWPHAGFPSSEPPGLLAISEFLRAVGVTWPHDEYPEACPGEGLARVRHDGYEAGRCETCGRPFVRARATRPATCGAHDCTRPW